MPDNAEESYAIAARYGAGDAGVRSFRCNSLRTEDRRKRTEEKGRKMDRTEFMDRLQRALAGGVNSSRVAENMRYYQDYIDTEVRKGRSEAEVLSGLGDPRLLAKSIIEANKSAGYHEGTNQNFDEERRDDRMPENGRVPGGIVRVPGWLILLIVTVIALLVIGVVFSVISFLTPILIPVLIVMLIYHFIRSR